MGKITITSSDGTKKDVEGAFSFDAVIDIKTNVVDISGIMTVRGGYVDDAVMIENDRYELTGVRIYAESYGSETEDITYSFKATDYSITI